MESPATSKAIVSSEIGNGSRTSPRPSGGTCSCSGSIAAPAQTRPMIGTELSSRYSMMGVISEALVRRSPDRISDTAPGRTPIAVARPPLVLPGFSSPRSIIVTSSMATSFPNYGNYSNSDFQKYSLTILFGISEIKGYSSAASLGATRNVRGRRANADKLGERAFGRIAGISGERDVLFGDSTGDQRQVQDRLFPQRRHRQRQANGDCWPRPRQGSAQALARPAASPATAASQIARTPCTRVHSADAAFRAHADRQAPLCRGRSSPYFAYRSPD